MTTRRSTRVRDARVNGVRISTTGDSINEDLRSSIENRSAAGTAEACVGRIHTHHIEYTQAAASVKA
jgi:hypothetical protein